MGRALVAALTRASADVYVVSRQPGPRHLSWEEVATRGLPDRTTAVINVAGLGILDAPFADRKGDGFWQEVVASRVHTTQLLTRALLRLPPPATAPRLLAVISGVGFYPYSETATYDESSAGGEGNFFAELTRDWEAASQLPPQHPTRRVLIRSGVVLGPGGGIVSRLFWPFFAGVGGPIGWRGEQFFPFISLEDLVRLFLFAVQEERVTGILNGVSPHVVRNRDFARAFGSAMRRPALLPFPDPLVHLLFGERRAHLLLRGMRVLPTRVQQLGFTYSFPDVADACRYALLPTNQ